MPPPRQASMRGESITLAEIWKESSANSTAPGSISDFSFYPCDKMAIIMQLTRPTTSATTTSRRSAQIKRSAQEDISRR